MSENDYSKDIFIDNNSNVCVIIFHGLGANPYDLRHLAEEIAQLDVDVKVPLLPFHGVSSDELSKLENIEEIFNWGTKFIQKEKTEYATIIAMGFSLGTGVSLVASDKTKIPKALVLMSAAGRFSILIKIIFTISRLFKINKIPMSYNKRAEISGWSQDYLNWRKTNFGYIPLHLLYQGYKSTKRYSSRLKFFDRPIMIVNGTEDVIIGRGTIKFYFDRISSKTKVGVKIKGATHSLFASGCKNEIVHEIKKFVEIILESRTDKRNFREVTERITLKTFKIRNLGEPSFSCELEDDVYLEKN